MFSHATHLSGRSHHHRALKSKQYGRGNKGLHIPGEFLSVIPNDCPCAALGLLISECQEIVPEGTDPQFCFLSFIPNISGHWQPEHTLDLHLTGVRALSMFCFIHFLLTFADTGWHLSCMGLCSFLP